MEKSKFEWLHCPICGNTSPTGFSRSVPDFATMMELFQGHNMQFVSSTEKFDTHYGTGYVEHLRCIRPTGMRNKPEANDRTYYSRYQRDFHMNRTLWTEEFEQFVYGKMVKKLFDFKP